MARIDDALHETLKSLPPKPSDDSSQADKKAYSERLSKVLAENFGEEFRNRGLEGTRPASPGSVGLSGAERRMSGGIGAKKVDVTWATEQSGLILGASIKTISFKDKKTGNYQKNLVNRRGDLLIEAVTLHRRFPYAVLMGFLFLDYGADSDATRRRRSTFQNTHQRLRLFTGRKDPAGRDEQYERLYVVLLDANPFAPRFEAYQAGDDSPTPFETIFDNAVELIAERNAEFFEADGAGSLRAVQ